MKPILLKGHERSITKVIYNRDGDLIFTASKDDKPSLWYSDSGERIGTYIGHGGAVWDIDVNAASTMLVSGSADTMVKLWEVQSGNELVNIPHKGPVRSVQFDDSGTRLMTVSDPFMSAEATVSIFDLERNVSEQSATPTLAITDLGHTGKIKWAKWLPLSKEIVTAGEDGWIRFFDATTGEATEGAQQLHTKVIQDVQFNKEKTLMVTSSIDQSVVLFDVLHKTILKRYEVDRPVNSSAISPLKEHVLIGGGQDAMSVTTSSARSGKFECMFYHMILNKELGNVKGHFGPINTIAVNPNGRSYCSGGEDGYIRLHHFDASYFSMEG